jgi:hypothetical protein
LSAFFEVCGCELKVQTLGPDQLRVFFFAPVTFGITDAVMADRAYSGLRVSQANKMEREARCWWLLRRQRWGGSQFKTSLGKKFKRPYLENSQHKNELAEWVKR